MDDVFAGTSGKAPLGRAEVILTIDNADGAPTSTSSEVNDLARCSGRAVLSTRSTANLAACSMFRELLSDSGIGRRCMSHVVGQGRLDNVLHALRRPPRVHRKRPLAC